MAAEGPGPTAPSRPLLAPQPPSPAQVTAGVLGGALLVIGLLGLAVNSSFDTGGGMDSDKFLIFGVNGWDDIIPGVVFGIVLLASAPSRSFARLACRIVAIAYLVLFIAGLAGGHDVWGFLPAGAADDVLRALLAVVLWYAARISKDRRDTIGRDRVVIGEDGDEARIVGPGSGHVGGPRVTQPRIDRRLPQKTHP